MSHWAVKYSDEQRAAVERAGLELRIRPKTRISLMAAAGELRPTADADALPAFKIPDATVNSMVSKAERRRRGEDLPGALAKLPARDRAEHLQRRLTGLIDNELDRLEKAAKRGKPLDGEAARRLARAIRELSTLPDPKDMRLPRTPGDRVPGTEERPDARTRDGLAGRLFAASDRHAATTDAPVSTDGGEHDQATGDATHTTTAHPSDHDHAHHDHATLDGAPCSDVRVDGASIEPMSAGVRV